MHYGAYDDDAPLYDAVDIWGADPAPNLRELFATTGYTKLTLFPAAFGPCASWHRYTER